MAILNNNPLIGASGNQGGYNINNSLRFRSSASAYLNRTPASAGNRKTWTWSAWVKRGALGATYSMFSAYPSDGFTIRFQSDDTLRIYDYVSSYNIELKTTQVFRDPSAWYHIVFAVDTTQATSSNRCKLYVNSVQVTAFSTATYPTQNSDLLVNSTTAHFISKDAWATNYLDGYLTEINFIDGQALTPSSFGETDTTTGVWKPKAYTGTYGTNGFYLKFSDIATTSGSNAGLGKDFSGNSNYWNTNNISVTSGTTYDAMTDSPTNTSATVANYAVMNPLSSASGTLTNGNLTFSNAGAVKGAKGTFALESGKWYWENTITTLGANDLGVGILFDGATDAMRDGTATSTYSVFYQANTNVRKNGTVVANYASYTTGDIIGIAYDADTRSITFYKNNTSQGSITADAPTSPYVVWIIQPNTITATVNANFGQRPFTYTPPTSYVALNTYNLPTPTILQGNKYMDATLYTGNGSTQTITNAGAFKPDLVWVKARSSAIDHQLFDSVRGVNIALQSNATNAEGNYGTMSAFNSNGFTAVLNGSYAGTNQNGTTYVGWQWQAGQGSTSSNTSGSITSTVSVNTTAGFSVLTYTGNNTLSTIGHGLGAAPKFIIVKTRSGTDGWVCYHASLGVQYYTFLNTTAASYNNLANYWGSTAPSSTTFSINAYGGVNTNGATYVAYCWAEIAGFSKFGSYDGNGQTGTGGPFIYTGFRPAFVLIKKYAGQTDDWFIFDNKRNVYNVTENWLQPNTSSAETSNVYNKIDMLSNGFGIRVSNATFGMNVSGTSFIYMAFAEHPFKNALAR